jgi:hypothetical protein
MENLTLEEQRLLQAELSGGESVLWTGKPNPRVVFHPSDWAVIPFSLMWGGFAIFWELGVLGMGPFGNKGSSWNFGVPWGIPFVIMGQYFIWGRFLYVAWKKARIVYALTNERILLVVRPPQSRVLSLYLRSIPGVEKEIRSDGIGTLKFGETPPVWGGRGTKTASELYLNSPTPVFVDIDNAVGVADLVTRELRRVSRSDPKAATFR